MGIFRRGQVWWMGFTFQGKRIKRSTETRDKKLAEKIYHKVMAQIAEGKWFDVDEGGKRTFLELAERYESMEFKELKSWRSVESYLKQIKEFFGPLTVSQINPVVIEDFKQLRKAAGDLPSTVVRKLTILKRIFNLARKRWLWVKDVPPIEMPAKADRKRLRYLSFAEYHVLLEKLEPWLRGPVIVAAWTGFRRSNVLNLKRSQVSISSRTISLDASETKNGEHLIIPVASPALEAIKEAMRVAHLNSPYVFCKADGQPFYPMEVQRAFKDALAKAEIGDFRFHDLRHCFASWNRQAGVDLDTLADLMGHKDTRMTRRYAHIGPKHLADAVAQLEKSYLDFGTISEQSKEKELRFSP